MTDATVDGSARPHTATKRRSSAFRTARTIHKVAGLMACAWLFVLGVTGVILDHEEWRWPQQMTWPAEWTSPTVYRLVRGTIMRFVAIDPANPEIWVGASQRGLWRTQDRGQNWLDIPFEGEAGTPQVFTVLQPPEGGLQALTLATDDGIWSLDGTADTPMAQRLGLAGLHIHSLGHGSIPGELVGAVDHSRIFRINGEQVTWLSLDDVRVENLPDSIDLTRIAFDMHFGYGILPKPYGIWVQDYGGVAMAVLAFTGLLFWYLPRRWRGKKPKGSLKHRNLVLRWMYRGHGPVIGLLAVVPILYLSLSALPLNHVYDFLEWGEGKTVPRDRLPWAYQFQSLTGEIRDVVAYEDAPDRLSISTRMGILETQDAGKNWTRNTEVGVTGDGSDATNVQLFRNNDKLFMGFGGGRSAWQDLTTGQWYPIQGPSLAIWSATQDVTGAWYVKTSRAIYKGSLTDGFEATDIPFPPLNDTTMYLAIADLHTGHMISDKHFKWVNDLACLLAISLVITGPIAWWRRRWM